MLVFRADGNSTIGSGHIMRCLSIADAARDIGEESLFITASNDMEPVIRSRGYKNIVLNTDYRDMDSENIVSALESCDSPVVFVDSYYVSSNYLEMLKRYCKMHSGKLVYIDDIKQFAYPCDVLINYQVHGSKKEYDEIYAGKEKPEYIIGTNYVPLRKQFLNVKSRSIKKIADNILVSTGGSDPEHITIELIRLARQSKKHFHFIIGAVNKDKTLIVRAAENSSNITLHENVSNMSELMQICDVAISASGSTLYELCATQTPTLTFVLADNQIQIAEGFSSRGIIKNCGSIKQSGTEIIAQKLMQEALNLCENYEGRKAISSIMKSVVDGHGAGRIIDKVISQ